MAMHDDKEDRQSANLGYKPTELNAGYCPAEDENKLEAKLPDPPVGGSGENGKDSKEE
jgi:hypothetical protein